MQKYRIIAIILTFVISFSQVSALEITIKSKYQDALDHLRQIDLIEDQKKFGANKLINKAEFVSLVLKNAGYDASEMKRKVFRTPFKDVPMNAWYAPYVFVALENGLIAEEEYFNPSKNVTRFEALKFFFTLEGINTPIYAKNENEFRDVPQNSKAAPFVLKALELDLIVPEEKDFFGVLQKMKKGEVAIMLYEYEVYKAGLNSSTGETESSDSIQDIPNAEVLVDVWERIHSDYLFEEDIDDEKMVSAAIEAMVGTLDDPFSVFMPTEEGSEYSDSLDGELEGIGAYLGVEDGKIMIISPIQGSPAQEAGLKPNDQIIKVDDESVEGAPLFEVVKKIKGPKDTQVTITVLRGEKEIKVEITRARIEIKSVELEMKDGYAVISLNQFISRTPQEFADATQEILQNNARGLILDLRNNPGGYLGVSIDLLGYFVEKGEVVVSIDYPRTVFEQKAEGNAELAGLPVVVLINEGSASASEIVAGSLQDMELATIIGQTSYGKGTVQELTFYNDGSNLKLTIAKWLTPNGTWINEVGVVPDVEVENKEGIDRDYQMERAMEEVRKM